jgi:hypothetical protein
MERDDAMSTGEDYISMSANSGLSNRKQLLKRRHFTKYFAWAAISSSW